MPQLTLVGVGPGDPELLTVAAVKAIEAASVVAYPVARLDADGMAARIAAPWIGVQQRRLRYFHARWGSTSDTVAKRVKGRSDHALGKLAYSVAHHLNKERLSTTHALLD